MSTLQPAQAVALASKFQASRRVPSDSATGAGEQVMEAFEFLSSVNVTRGRVPWYHYF